MYLQALLKDFTEITDLPAIKVGNLCLDSRQVGVGDVFLACKGLQTDGRNFVDAAIKRGAAAVLYEQFRGDLIPKHPLVPIIPVSDLKDKLSALAARYYDYPSNNLEVFGVTGTNGKSSFCYLLAHILHALHKPCGVIGTLGAGFVDNLKTTGFTTPDAIMTQRILADQRNLGATYVAMEVTSHALDQGRVAGVHFHTAIFTNLSRDHMDYHKDLAAYAAAKRRLFEWPDLQNIVLNLDDPFSWDLIRARRESVRYFGYGIERRKWPINGNALDNIIVLEAAHINSLPHGTRVEVISPYGNATLEYSLMGQFNVKNLLAVLAAGLAAGFAWQDLLQQVPQLPCVPGRMQAFGGGGKPVAIVDFAHTPQALEQALDAAREHVSGDLWCVFGCGGERDRGKRGMMGAIAEARADHVIVTNDNPRGEDPKSIVADILNGMRAPSSAKVEYDRNTAIGQAIQHAVPGDVILVAGKGHEAHQIIAEQRIPYRDDKTVQAWLEEY